ncbi:hypothetical protein, partial [Sphingobium jiangsuense]
EYSIGPAYMKPTLERAARAICRFEGHPENIQFEGRAMWQSYLPQARAVLQAIEEPDMAMVSAAVDKAKQIGAGDFVGIYRAMIGAVIEG